MNQKKIFFLCFNFVNFIQALLNKKLKTKHTNVFR